MEIKTRSLGALCIDFFLFLISNSKRETQNNVREYQELQQVLVCGFLKVQFKALTPFSIQSCRSFYATLHQRPFYKIFVKFRNSKKMYLNFFFLIIVNINKDENKSLVSKSIQFLPPQNSSPRSVCVCVCVWGGGWGGGGGGVKSILNKGNNKITELRTILQRESQNS